MGNGANGNPGRHVLLIAKEEFKRGVECAIILNQNSLETFVKAAILKRDPVMIFHAHKCHIQPICTYDKQITDAFRSPPK